MPDDSLWIIGHRPVISPALCRSQCDDKLVQINDDRRQLVAFVPIDGVFDRSKHIIDLLKK